MNIQLELDKLKTKSKRSYRGNSIPIGSQLGKILISSSGSFEIANAIRVSESNGLPIKVTMSIEYSRSIIEKINAGK